MWIIKRLLAQGLALILSALLVACGGGGTDPATDGSPARQLSSLSITNISAPLSTNSTIQLEIIAQFSDGTTENYTTKVSWSTSDQAVATINAGGTLFTKQFVDNVTITASFENLQVAKTFSIAPNEDATLQSYSLTGLTQVSQISVDQEVKVSGIYTDGSTKNDIPAMIRAISTTDDGNTLIELQVGGKAITATVTSGPNSSLVATIQELSPADPVNTDAIVISIEINASKLSLTSGSTLAVSVTGLYDDNSVVEPLGGITWTSTGAISVSTNGFVKANNVETSSSGILTASYGELQASLEFTIEPAPVTQDPVSTVTLSSIEIDATVKNLQINKSTALSATAVYSDGSRQNISSQASWVSSDNSIATVNGNGFVNAKDVVGTTNITASFNGKSDTIAINVFTLAQDAVVTSLKIHAPKTTLAPGETVQLTLTAIYNNDDSTETEISDNVTWVSANLLSVQVDYVTGLATASNSANSSIITASFAGLTQTITLKVAVSLTGIEISGPTVLDTNASQLLSITRLYNNGTKNSLLSKYAIWTSGDTNLATMDKNGFITTKTIEGDVTVTAVYQDIDTNQSFSDEFTVSIKEQPAVLTGIRLLTVTGNTALNTNETVGLKVLADFSKGPAQDITSNANISSSNTSIISLNGSQAVAGTTLDKATITAEYEGLSAQLELSVKQLTGITIGDFSTTLGSSKTYNLPKVWANYSDQSKTDISNQIVWSTSDSSIVSINGTQLLTSTLLGSATLTAALTSPNAQTSVDVLVLPAEGDTIASIQIVDSSVVMLIDDIYKPNVRAIFSSGAEMKLTTGLSWGSHDETIASVNENGEISSHKLTGSTRIYAVFTDSISGNSFNDGITVSVYGEGSYDYIKLKAGLNPSHTYIEDSADIAPEITANYNPVGLIDGIPLSSPQPGYSILLRANPGALSKEQLLIVLNNIADANFDKSTSFFTYTPDNSAGEYYVTDNSTNTSINISLTGFGTTPGEKAIADFSAQLCRKTIVDAAADCSETKDRITVSGSFYVTVEDDAVFTSYNLQSPKNIDNSVLNNYQSIASGTASHYQFSTVPGISYTLSANNPDVTIQVYSDALFSSALPVNTNVFMATGNTTYIQFLFNSNAVDGATFSFNIEANAPVAQGSESSPFDLQGPLMPIYATGTVDNGISYYSFNVQPGYKYRVNLKTQIIEGDALDASKLFWATDLSGPYNSCSNIAGAGVIRCNVINSRGDKVYFKVDNTGGNYSIYNLILEYDNDYETFTTLPVVDFKGQANSNITLNPDTGGGNTVDGSIYWTQGLKQNQSYKIRIKGISDYVSLYINDPQSILIGQNYFGPKCEAAGNQNYEEVFCVVTTKNNLSNIAFSGISVQVVGWWASRGTTYTISIEEIAPTTVYYFATYKNFTTYTLEACNLCTELDFYHEGQSLPFASTFTDNLPYSNMALNLQSGEKVYVRVSNPASSASAYTIQVSTNAITRTESIQQPALPDSQDAGLLDNSMNTANTLELNIESSHTLHIDGNVKDVDWFVFTAP